MSPGPILLDSAILLLNNNNNNNNNNKYDNMIEILK